MQDQSSGVYGQVGISIPIFNTALKNKQKALIIKNEIAESKLQLENLKLKSKYQELLQIYQKRKTTVDYFETKALKNVEIIKRAVDKKLKDGDINYLEWVLLMNQNTETESKYIESVRELNNAISDIKELTQY